MNYPRSIGDEYKEYVDDEYGYQYHAWEVISASESTRHEEIRLGDDEFLDACEERLDTLSDLELWALGRRRLKQDQRRAYFACIERILDGNLAHRALAYPEIFADAARRKAEEGDYGRADELIDAIAKNWPILEKALPFLRAQVLLVSKKIDEADRAYEAAMENDTEDGNDSRVDLLIEIAEDFLRFDAPEVGLRWVERARQAAIDSGDTASLVDIELMIPDDAV